MSANHEGWANFATWAVQLWIANDESLYRQHQAMVADALEQAERSQGSLNERQACFILADAAKDWLEDMRPRAVDGTVWADLIGAALGDVDWDEIADAWLSEQS